jgi:hypothetical protein
LACSPTWLDCLLSRLADITECLGDCAAWAERLLAELADAADGVVDGLDEALEDLGVAIERRQRAVEDVVQVLQPNLQQRLRLHAADVHLDLVQMDVHASDDLEQVRELRPQRGGSRASRAPRSVEGVVLSGG